MLLRCLALVLCLFSLPAAAGTPKNALGAIAVAPNGQWIVAAGDNLTLYVIEAATMTVHSRHWIGLNPEQLAFSGDGKTLLVIDTDSSLTFLDAATFQPRSTVTGLRSAAVLAGADRVVAMASPQKKDGKATTDIVVHALSDGAEVLRVTADAEGSGVGGAADGSMFALLTRPFETSAETKTKAPDDKKGFDKNVFDQQNDGKASEVLLFNAQGAPVARHPLWYSTTAITTMALSQGHVNVLVFDNLNLRVDIASGASEMFRIGDGLNYGIGFSADHGRIATGGLAAGNVGAIGGTVAAFKTDRVGNWPEYFKGFAFAPDGSVYGGSTGYRLFHIGADGAVKAAVPVF